MDGIIVIFVTTIYMFENKHTCILIIIIIINIHVLAHTKFIPLQLYVIYCLNLVINIKVNLRFNHSWHLKNTNICIHKNKLKNCYKRNLMGIYIVIYVTYKQVNRSVMYYKVLIVFLHSTLVDLHAYNSVYQVLFSVWMHDLNVFSFKKKKKSVIFFF